MPALWTTSPFIDEIAPITADDAAIRSALEQAQLPPLLPALAYLTGDLGLLRPDLRVDTQLTYLPQCGLTDDQQRAILDLAFETIRAFRDGGSHAAAPPDASALRQIMHYAVGADVVDESMDAYLPLLQEELGIRAGDRRAPQWHASDHAGAEHLDVIVIGAGMSGILAAHRLHQAGLPFVVLEKNDDVGGTWLENTYPGCRVDNPNHNYSYSFAQRHDWPRHYSTNDVLLEYLQRCTDAFGVRDHIRFGTEVRSARWLDDERRWEVRIRRDGEDEVLTAAAVISAVGQLNRPRIPDLPGLDEFAGPVFHSARWRHDLDLTGCKVAVIGTGASAAQFAPEIAPDVEQLAVFQRHAPWLLPTPDYHDEVGPGLRWLYEHVPSYSEWNRFWIFWQMGDAALDRVRVDPAWDRSGGSLSADHEFIRWLLSAYLEAELAGRPDLLADARPDYPPGGKRIIRDNGSWTGMLKRPNVAIVRDPIERITEQGIVTRDGTLHEADVLILATGFEASSFLAPMQVTGAGGVDLHDHWAGSPRAYLGVTVPGFPNLFCLYGPNTNIVVNGSIVYFSECGVRYILGCLEHLARTGQVAMSVRQDVHDRFNDAVDDQNAKMAWGVDEVDSWYKDGKGRVSQNWPFTLLEYWQRTLAPDPAEFDVLGPPA